MFMLQVLIISRLKFTATNQFSAFPLSWLGQFDVYKEIKGYFLDASCRE